MGIYRGAGGTSDAVNDASSEAVLVQQLAVEAQADADAAAASATAAAGSASTASTAASNALTAETNAETAETNAETAETNAETAQAAAEAAQVAAETAQTAAELAETNAETAETNAETAQAAAASSASAASSSASTASTQATNASNSASAASTSATNASNSASAASTSASNASTSATAAASSASAASTSASNASTSATNAANSATSASTSATTATTQAGIATTQATNAASSASAASTSATNAASSATSASGSATTATTQATAAGTSATNAAASASTATTQATNAASSATAAAGSATSASASAAAASAVALGSEPVRHSVRPSLLLDFANTKTLDPRITFTRASTGTFYDGKTVAKAEENLFLQSQALATTPWTGNNATATNNTVVAPDGTTTASTITEALTTNFHLVSQGVAAVGSGNTYTYSCYGKNNTGQYLILGAYTGTSTYASAIFDLSGGTVSSSGAAGSGWSVTSTSITSVGNGWYRCVITFVSGAAAPNLAVGLSNSTIIGLYGLVSYLGTGNSIYVWGAQLEQRSSVTAYTATTTAPITNYIPALQSAASGVARFEHNPTTGESLGLKIEEQRTNLAIYSSDFSNAAWTASRASIQSNVVVAPDGTLTAEKLVEDTTASNDHRIFQSITTTAAAHTYSVYAKAAERSRVFLRINDSGGISRTTIFNISSGAIELAETGITASTISVGNGWYRCIATITTALAGSQSVLIGTAIAGGTNVYTGDGYSGIYIWGAQLEAGSFATSYIPTVASQVTRSADNAEMTGANFSSWYRADEGTLYADYQLIATTNNLRAVVQISNPATGNYTDNFGIEGQSGANALIYAGMQTSGVQQAAILLVTAAINTPYKNAMSYKTNNIVGAHNGTLSGTDTTARIPIVTQLFIGRRTDGNRMAGTIKKIAYYPLQLTNAELQGLTTV
jgi:hypothetical protein